MCAWLAHMYWFVIKHCSCGVRWKKKEDFFQTLKSDVLLWSTVNCKLSLNELEKPERTDDLYASWNFNTKQLEVQDFECFFKVVQTHRKITFMISCFSLNKLISLYEEHIFRQVMQIPQWFNSHPEVPKHCHIENTVSISVMGYQANFSVPWNCKEFLWHSMPLYLYS